jgi:hypothetical protein
MGDIINNSKFGSVIHVTSKRDEFAFRYVVCNCIQTWNDFTFSVAGHDEYLQQLLAHRFTAVPFGYGLDSHRMWEALYLGSIPGV